MKKIIAVITAIALLCPLFALTATATPSAELLRLTNAQRAAQGRFPVRGDNASLHAAAQLRAREAAQYWSHTRPDGSNWSTVLAQFNISGHRVASENLAFTSTNNPANAINVWMNSPSHRDNLLASSHRHVGFGMYFCSRLSRYFWAQLFIDNGGFLGAIMRFVDATFNIFWLIITFPVAWLRRLFV